MKHLLYTFLIAVFFTACKPTTTIITSKKENSTKSEKRRTGRLIKQLIDSATDNIGVRYKYGGTTNAGFDCSGLISTIFSCYNISIPHSSYEQSKLGMIINQDREEAKKGDLIFFKTNGESQINHVGIVIEVDDDEIKFIHTSGSKGVIISSTKESYYQRTFAQLNRIL